MATQPMNSGAARYEGTLGKWNADRGFGFLVVQPGQQELFVHISAFPSDGRVPRVGEAFSFEVSRDREGRKQAVNLRRPGAVLPASGTIVAAGGARRERHRAPPPPSGGGFMTRVIAVLIVAALGWYGYTHYRERVAVLSATQQVPTEGAPPVPLPLPEAVQQPAGFRCDGRLHCSQMTSCSEAKLFLRHCPGTMMDGDGDGIPCEQQLCTGLFGN